MALNIFITIVFLFAVVQSTRGENWELRAYKGSRNDSMAVNWQNATQLISSGYVKTDNYIVFLVFGFTGTNQTQHIPDMIDAHLKIGYYVVLVQWERLANPNLNYFKAAENSQIVGEDLGKALSYMVSAGVQPNRIILLGISLGAHVCGRAGFVFQLIVGKKILLIVMVDGSKPLFEVIEVYRRTKRTDAQHVISLKSDPNVFGLSGNYGSHNIEFNPLSPRQPGCLGSITSISDPISAFEEFNLYDAIFCSHGRAALYWIETIYLGCTMKAKQASSTTAWVLSKGKPGNISCVGYDMINSGIEGNFYLHTNAEPPFGLGDDGAEPDNYLY